MKRRFLACLLALAPVSAQAAERRCGWLDNPTPANWWLTDRQGEWIISTQGGEEASGMEHIPDISDRQWVKTNGWHGYGCACLTVDVNRRDKRITRILSGTELPLRTCRNDRALPRKR